MPCAVNWLFINSPMRNGITALLLQPGYNPYSRNGTHSSVPLNSDKVTGQNNPVHTGQNHESIFLFQDIKQLSLIGTVRLQSRITHYYGIRVYGCSLRCNLPIRRICFIAVHVQLQNMLRCKQITQRGIREEVPIIPKCRFLAVGSIVRFKIFSFQRSCCREMFSEILDTSAKTLAVYSFCKLFSSKSKFGS